MNALQSLLWFLIPIAVLATIGALGLGIFSLAKGGRFAKENSNKLMRLRVALQTVAVALMLLFLWVASRNAGGA
ncbi:MAG: twin transmembrane helix small protein [Pseudomonadota bacterium]